MTFITRDAFRDFGSSGNLGYSVGEYAEFDNSQGFNSIGFNLVIPSGSTVLFYGSFDGDNFSPVTIRRVSNDGYVKTTSVSDTFIGSISSLRKFRAYVATSGGTFGTIKGRASREVSTLEGIENAAPNDFALNLAEGKIANHLLINKFGNNLDIDTGTVPEDIWASGGLYPGFPTTGGAQKLRIYSTSSSDTYNGTGARTLYLEGLDSSFLRQSETVTLSGALPVLTLNQYTRCNRSHVVTAGSNGGTVGTIAITNQSGVAFATVEPNENQTHQAVYTIPSGTTGYLIKVYASIRRVSGNTFDRDANLDLFIRPPGGVFRARRPIGITTGSSFETNIYGGIPIPEMSDVALRCTSVSENNTDIAAGFDIILVDN